MSLTRHEFLTELRRWWWFIPLWWGIVLIDLGYQCAWWWEFPSPSETGSTSWDSRDDFHSELSDALSYLIQIGLFLSAVVVFLDISPERPHSAQRLRPIPERQRILSRLALLCIAIGLPWWLHEWYFIFVGAESGIAMTMVATAERIVLTASIWFAGIILARISGTLGKVAFFGGLFAAGFLGVVALLEFAEKRNLVPWASHNTAEPDLENAYRYAWLLSTLFAGILVCMGYRVLVRAGKVSSKTLSVVVALSGIITTSTFGAWEKGAHRLAIAIAADHEISPLPVVVGPGEHRSGLSVRDEGNLATVNWSIFPQMKPLPENLVAHFSGTGRLRLPHGGHLDFPRDWQNAYVGWRNHSKTESELRHLVDAFPEFSVFSPSSEPDHTVHLSTKPFPPSRIPDTKSFEGHADLLSGLWKWESPESLPLDGKTASLGSLGRAWVHQVIRNEQSIEFRIRFYENRILLPKEYTLSKRQFFALSHPEKEMVIFSTAGASSRVIRGKHSALPLSEMTVNFNSQSSLFPSSAEKSGWLESASLILIEQSYVGSVKNPTELKVVDSSGFLSGLPYRKVLRKRLASVGLPPESVLADPGSAHDAIEKAVYEIARRPDAETSPAIEVAPVHREILRELVLAFEPVAGAFEEFWTPADGKYFLEALPGIDQRNGTLLGLARKNNWFLQNPDILERWLEDEFPMSDSALKAALEWELPSARERLYRSRLGRLDETVDSAEFPEIWEAEKRALQKQWENERWKIRNARSIPLSAYQLAKMGEPNPLREALEWFVRWEPEIQHPRGRSGYAYSYQIPDPWPKIEERFDPEETVGIETQEEKVSAVRRWLDSDWRYDPETMRYSIAE